MSGERDVNGAGFELLLQQAIQLHQQGSLADAERLYRQILRGQPRHFDALHLLGVIALQTNHTTEALDLIETAIRIKPNVATAHNNLGNGRRIQGDLCGALASYDQAITLKPDYAEAYSNRGYALWELKRYEEAVASCDRAIALNPDHVNAYNNRGIALRNLARPDEAIASYDKAIMLKPDEAVAYNNRGNAQQDLKRYGDAIASYSKAVALKPDYAHAYNNCGNALRALNRHGEAIVNHDRAIALNPDYAEAHNNRGHALRELMRYEDAVVSYDKAIALKPDYAEAYGGRGIALRNLARHEEAIISYDKAIALKPDHAEAYNNRGNALQDLRRYDEAIFSYDKALALTPDYAEACYHRGHALRELARHEEAVTSYDRAIALKPDYAEAYSNRGVALQDLKRFEQATADHDMAIALNPDSADLRLNQGLLLLQLGDFEQGWKLYEWRKKLSKPVGNRTFLQPVWLGQEDLKGKTLFIYWEQGFGDTLQFCRYAMLAKAREAQVILSVHDPLVRLVAQMDPAIRVVGSTQVPVDFDYHCPVMSLPLAFGTKVATIPSAAPYLHADEQKSGAWRSRLAALPGLKIGLVWAGSPENLVDRRRSITLNHFAPLTDVPGLCLIPLQKGEPSIQARTPPDGMVLHDWTEELNDFADTADLVEALDLVISVDTSVAHLAGALGKPVWILNRYDQCWRWLTGRCDSPWYPSARLFSQRDAGNWDDVIAQVARALHDLVRGEQPSQQLHAPPA